MVYVQEILGRMNVCVIIPAYNEADRIGELVKKIRGQGLVVLVVNDGSTDNTVGMAKENGAEVISNVKNSGKGASLLKGFEYALTNGFDAAITMDADGQHLAADIQTFIKKSESENTTIIVGNRMSNTRTMPLLRIIINKLMSWLISYFVKQNIADTQCGFRLIKRQVLEKIELRTQKFEIESEMLLEADRHGFKIHSVPIQTVYIDEQSHIRPFRDTIRFFKFLFQYRRRFC
jgi:glycosyltransferase involved in cell wall biosynthesis